MDIALPLQLPHFRPRFPWVNAHLQMLRTAMCGRLDLSRWRSVPLDFPMADGTGDALTGTLTLPPADTGQPLCILIHGVTGCENSQYLIATARQLLRAGFPVLRVSMRGAGRGYGRCRENYHAGRWQDLAAVLDQIPTRRGVVLIGYSLGGNILLNLLGALGPDPRVRAAITISAPLDLGATSRRMLLPANRPYHNYLLRKIAAECLASTGMTPELRQAARTARSFYEFDDRVMAPRYGFRDADDYHHRNSGQHALPRIGVPTLLIHAEDDPWIPCDAYRSFAWANNPRLQAVVAPAGGHVGFHADCGGTWSDRCILEFTAPLQRRKAGTEVRRAPVRERRLLAA
ncbi:MAG TPA: alpha/beta fold hydrolase [Alphaproteobacteria bacterium]|nr:alpha/beta fold hydrolase [Alphaproteobacteria bacterium]